jgi:hypothetical protein
MHYYAWYMKHVAKMPFVRLEDEELLKYCIVACGGDGTHKLSDALVNSKDFSKIGVVDVRTPAIQDMLTRVEACANIAEKEVAATKLFTYMKDEALDLIQSNPRLKDVILAKCEQFRRDNRNLRNLFRIATELIVALGVEPAKLPSDEEYVMSVWHRCPSMAIKLQIDQAPAEEAILSRDETVWTPERSRNLYQFFNGYCKRHNIPQRKCNLLSILKMLMLSSGVNVYEQCLSGALPPELNRHDVEKRLRGSCECMPCSQARIRALETELAECKAKLAAIAKLL